MDITMSGKMIVNASKKVLDSIMYAFSEDADVEDIIEIDDDFADLQGDFDGEDIVYKKNILIIPFEQSYEIFDFDSTLDLVKRLLNCFPSIRTLEFEGTENSWSSGECGSFRLVYKNQTLSVAYTGMGEISEWLSDVSEDDDEYNDMQNSLCYEFESNEKVPFELMPVGDFEVENFENEEITCEGLSFCVTGKLHLFENREEIGEYIEDNGGTLVGSVSNNTDFLINNDVDSNSKKNIKANELGIPIISEEKFVALFGE